MVGAVLRRTRPNAICISNRTVPFPSPLYFSLQIPVIINRSPFKGLIDEVYIGKVAVEPEDVKTAAEKGLEEALKIARSIEPQGKLTIRSGEIKSISFITD